MAEHVRGARPELRFGGPSPPAIEFGTSDSTGAGDRESIRVRLLKVLRLSQEGVGGERENAEAWPAKLARPPGTLPTRSGRFPGSASTAPARTS